MSHVPGGKKGGSGKLEARAGKHRATQTEQDTWTGARHLLPEGPAQVMRWDGWMDGWIEVPYLPKPSDIACHPAWDSPIWARLAPALPNQMIDPMEGTMDGALEIGIEIEGNNYQIGKEQIGDRATYQSAAEASRSNSCKSCWIRAVSSFVPLLFSFS